MNKIILFSDPGLHIETDDIIEIFSHLSESGLEWIINRPFANIVRNKTDIKIAEDKIYDDMSDAIARDAVMISYGGDGTLLEAVKHIYGYKIPVMGVNYGHLGFLASTPRNMTGQIFRQICDKEYEIQPRTLLEVTGDFDTPPAYPFALNEFTIHRTEINMTYVDVYVNNDKVATYRGDGVLISTPTGSTAYSLSVGGPIVSPVCECFVIAPIAPHNLTMRPMVIPDSSDVAFHINGRTEYISVSIDNRSYLVKSGSVFKVTKAKERIFLVKANNISFYDTLRNKMMWGLDSWETHK